MDGTFATDGSSTIGSKFTQPLAWDTSQVTTMYHTFYAAGSSSIRSSPGIRAG